jgi:hypothetical protein
LGIALLQVRRFGKSSIDLNSESESVVVQLMQGIALSCTVFSRAARPESYYQKVYSDAAKGNNPTDRY